MYGLEIYRRVRHAVLREGKSVREAAITFGVDRGTISKMTAFSEPPRCLAGHACMPEKGLSAEGRTPPQSDG